MATVTPANSTITDNVNLLLLDTGNTEIFKPNEPYITFISTTTIPGRIATIRDATGHVSTGNTILISTMSSVFFVDGTSSLSITQPYGFVTLTSRNLNRWSVLNTFAFPDPLGTSLVSNLNVLNTINTRSLNVNSLSAGILFVSSIFGNNFNTSNVSTNSISTNRITANTISTVSISTSRLFANSFFTTSISTQNISSSNVSTFLLVANSLSSFNLNTTTVLTNTLFSQTVSTNLINTSTVSSFNIRTNSISSFNIQSSNISTINLFTNSISTNNLFASNVIITDLLANSISSLNIRANNVSTNNLFANNVSTNNLFAITVSTGTVSTNSLFATLVSSFLLVGDTVSTNVGFINTISSLSIQTNTLSTNLLLANSISTLNIGANIVSTTTLFTNLLSTQFIQTSTISSLTLNTRSISSFFIQTSSLLTGAIQLRGTTSNGLLTTNTGGTQLLYNGSNVGAWVGTAASDLNMDSYSIINLTNINGTAVASIGANAWATFAATTNVNMNGYSIDNTETLRANTILANSIEASNSIVAPQSATRSNVATNRIVPYLYTDSYPGVSKYCDMNSFTNVLTNVRTFTFPTDLATKFCRANLNMSGEFLDITAPYQYYFNFLNTDTSATAFGSIVNSNCPYRYIGDGKGGFVPFGYTDLFDITGFAGCNFTFQLYIKPATSDTLSNYQVSATFEPVFSL